mgnify:CR=1 FL=1
MGKDGTLDYGKFAALTVHLQRMDNDEHLQKAFSHFDLDGNGFIDYDELKQALVDEMDDTELIKDIMNEVDTDKVRVVGKFPSIFINSHPILCLWYMLCLFGPKPLVMVHMNECFKIWNKCNQFLSEYLFL